MFLGVQFIQAAAITALFLNSCNVVPEIAPIASRN